MSGSLISRRDVAIIAAVVCLFVVLGTYVFGFSMETLDVKAEELGVEARTVFPSPFPEYAIPGVESAEASLALGLASTAGVCAAAYLAVRRLAKKTG